MRKKIRIVVILHLFYMKDWTKIKKYLANLDQYKFDFIVSYVQDYKEDNVLMDIINTYPQTTFFEVANRGYDVGPFFECLHQIDLKQYDIVYKLHSKGQNIALRYCYKRLFKRDDWFCYLYEAILSTKNVRRTIQKLMNSKDVGVVAARNLIIHDPVYKQELTGRWAKKLTIPMQEEYSYVAGTCFAVQAKALEPIQNWGIRSEDFEEVRRGKFSLAHALERLICINITQQGYKLHGISVCKIRRLLRRIEALFVMKSNSERLLRDKRFTIDSEFFYSFCESKYITSYGIVSIKLKDIKRKLKGEVYTLQECAPYKYLDGAVEQYEAYCSENSANSPYDMNTTRYNNLIASIGEHGYDEKYLPIVSEGNVVLDGQHRLCVLLKKYGEEHEVKVLRLSYRVVANIRLSKEDAKKIREIADNNKLFIYGAGRFGEKYYSVLRKNRIPIEGFVVTKASDRGEYLGKRVYSLDEIEDKNTGFVLALNTSNQREVIPKLEENGFYNYFVLGKD